MPNLTGPVSATAGEIFSSSSTQGHPLGTVGITRDGRKFRYCQAGASALVVGNTIQSAAQITTHQDMTPSAAAIGATTITVTPGATAGAANLYAEGWAFISVTPGLGYLYEISGHAAISASTAFTVNLFSDSSIQVALTTDSRVGVIHNPYKNVIQAPVTTLTGAVVGVAVYPIVATEYGWIQTNGPGGVLIGGTPGVGLAVVVPGTSAGMAVVDGAAAATKVIGTMMVTGQAGLVQPVLLDIQ